MYSLLNGQNMSNLCIMQDDQALVLQEKPNELGS